MKKTLMIVVMISVSGVTAQTVDIDALKTALPHVIGKKIYYVASDNRIESMRTGMYLESHGYGPSSFDREEKRPKLVPLEILSAELVSGRRQGEQALKYTFKLPNGDEDYETVPLTCFDGVDVTNEIKLFKAVACGEFLTAMPNLTTKEIAAIKNGTMFRGMSRRALIYSMGEPERENDWGLSGHQLIYNTSEFVYIRHGVVVDYQILDTGNN